MTRLSRLAMVCAAFCGVVSPTLANPAEPKLFDLADTVAGHPGLRYRDLIEQVLAGVTVTNGDATGRLRTPLRHLAGSDYGTALPDTVTASGFQVLPFRAGGQPMIALTASLGNVDDVVEQPEMLAVFEDGQQPRLVDTVDIGMDRLTGFARPARLALGKDDDALVIYSEHFNAGESYGTTAVAFLHDGKLQLVDTFSTYGMMSCSFRTSQVLSFQARREKPAGALDAIVAKVRDRRTLTGEACGDETPPAPFDTTISTTYRWDAGDARYEAEGDAIKTLQRETSDRL